MVDDPWLHTRGEAMLGELARLEGRFDDAVTHLERAIAVSRGRGYLQTEAYQQATLGRAQCQAGDYEAGAASLRLAIEKAEAIGDVRMAALAGCTSDEWSGRSVTTTPRTTRSCPRARGTALPAAGNRPCSASASSPRWTATSTACSEILDESPEPHVAVFALDALGRVEEADKQIGARGTLHLRTRPGGPMNQFSDVLARWLERDVLPNVIELDHADEYPTAMVEQMREFGLFGATIPTEYGGLGLSTSTYAEIVTQISAVWMSLTGVLNSHLMMAHLIRTFGTDAQRDDFLPKLASGELRGGLALTEPTCGSDLQAIRTTARRDGDTYIVNGTKTWITNGGRGNCLALLVKTDLDASPRSRGTSVLLALEGGRRLHRAAQAREARLPGVDTVELLFDDVAVDADRLLGGVEGRGIAQVLGGLELGRINVAARGVGVARRRTAGVARYANVRETMGRPIGQHQAIQLKLADMACRVESSRLLTERAAAIFDDGRRCDLEAGMAKLVATEAALENATEAMRIFGAYGYSTEEHIERYYRDAPLLIIGEGTNEIQRIVIARRLLAEAEEADR